MCHHSGLLWIFHNILSKPQIQIWGCTHNNPNQIWDTGYSFTALPNTSQNDQFGTNNCTGPDAGANCQTVWLKYAFCFFLQIMFLICRPVNSSADDFCLWAPRACFPLASPILSSSVEFIVVTATPNSIGNAERETIAYCTKSGRGARTIPNGALKGVHFVKTHDYVQVTGVGDFTKINILKGDAGGELDNRGADGMFSVFINSSVSLTCYRCLIYRQRKPR